LTGAAAVDESNEPGNDANLFVKFEDEPVRNGAKSDKAGRDIYENRTMISIMIPGDASTLIKRVVTDIDKRRFAAQWARYQSSQRQDIPEGTPLGEFAPVNAAQRKELEHCNCFTVEQLAGMSDRQCEQFGGWGRQLRDKAARWIESAKGFSGTNKIMEELEKMKRDNEALQAQLVALQQREAEPKRGPGRPAKISDDAA
jgi:hypothetical protein